MSWWKMVASKACRVPRLPFARLRRKWSGQTEGWLGSGRPPVGGWSWIGRTPFFTPSSCRAIVIRRSAFATPQSEHWFGGKSIVVVVVGGWQRPGVRVTMPRQRKTRVWRFFPRREVLTGNAGDNQQMASALGTTLTTTSGGIHCCSKHKCSSKRTCKCQPHGGTAFLYSA